MTKNERITERVNILKKMHQYIIDIGDENAYSWWIMAMPDEPQEDDFIWIAENYTEWREIHGLFTKICKKYLTNN